MSESLTSASCSEFSRQLASKRPVPGGGGAAALVGALAAALASMVGNYTAGKKLYAAYEADIERALDEAETARRALLALVDADAAAFEPLSLAYGIPKGDLGREAALESATRRALEPPLAMVREVAGLVPVLELLGKKGSRMLRSDVGCGAYLAGAALRCAALNVYVNTRSLADRAYASALNDEVEDLVFEFGERADSLAESVSAHYLERG